MRNPTIQSVIKDDFITVVLNGKTTNVRKENTAVFGDLLKALRAKDFAAVPGLLTIASKIKTLSQGEIKVRGEQIFYKGRAVDNSLTRRMVEGLKRNEDITNYMKFMDNVYQNPATYAQDELYDWLKNSDMPITDDGRFLAYKAVDSDYMSCTAGKDGKKVDNHPGEKPKMKREDVDPDRRNECSRGLHFCSLSYLRSFGGSRIMIVAVNPADVVSIPKDYGYSKGRTWTYEVLKEYGVKEELQEKAYAPSMAVEPIGSERQRMLADILAHPSMKRIIIDDSDPKNIKNAKKGKIKRSTLIKQTFARLSAMFSKLPQLVAPGQVIGNPLKAERLAAGLSLAELATELDVSKSAVWSAEQSLNPKAETINNVRLAIAELKARKK